MYVYLFCSADLTFFGVLFFFLVNLFYRRWSVTNVLYTSTYTSYFMEKLVNSKKGMTGGLNGLMSLVVTLGVVGITLAVVMVILTTTKGISAVAADGNATLAIGQTITSIGYVPQFLPILVIAVIGAVIIGVLVSAYFFGRGGSQV